MTNAGHLTGLTGRILFYSELGNPLQWRRAMQFTLPVWCAHQNATSISTVALIVTTTNRNGTGTLASGKRKTDNEHVLKWPKCDNPPYPHHGSIIVAVQYS